MLLQDQISLQPKTLREYLATFPSRVAKTADWNLTSLPNSMLGCPTGYGQLDGTEQYGSSSLHFWLCKTKAGAPNAEQNT